MFWHAPHQRADFLQLKEQMHFLFPISIYLGAALGLLSAGFIGLSFFTSSSASNSENASRPVEGTTRTIISSQKTQIVVRPDGKAFRYGPEVNHGRSDTPVYASAQALRDARATTALNTKRRPMYQERTAQGTTFGRGLSSGH